MGFELAMTRLTLFIFVQEYNNSSPTFNKISTYEKGWMGMRHYPRSDGAMDVMYPLCTQLSFGVFDELCDQPIKPLTSSSDQCPWVGCWPFVFDHLGSQSDCCPLSVLRGTSGFRHCQEDRQSSDEQCPKASVC
jgi:hypothetical protein